MCDAVVRKIRHCVQRICDCYKLRTLVTLMSFVVSICSCLERPSLYIIVVGHLIYAVVPLYCIVLYVDIYGTYAVVRKYRHCIICILIMYVCVHTPLWIRGRDGISSGFRGRGEGVGLGMPSLG